MSLERKWEKTPPVKSRYSDEHDVKIYGFCIKKKEWLGKMLINIYDEYTPSGINS